MCTHSNISALTLLYNLQFCNHTCCRPQTVLLILIPFLWEEFCCESAVLSVSLQHSHHHGGMAFCAAFIHSFILLSLLQEVHSLFQSAFSTECFPFQFTVHYMELECPEHYVLNFMPHISPTYNQANKDCGNEELSEYFHKQLTNSSPLH